MEFDRRWLAFFHVSEELVAEIFVQLNFRLEKKVVHDSRVRAIGRKWLHDDLWVWLIEGRFYIAKTRGEQVSETMIPYVTNRSISSL